MKPGAQQEITLDSLIAGLGNPSDSLTKVASESPAAAPKGAVAPTQKPDFASELAQILTKTASETKTSGDAPMNNAQLGNVIAASILEKLGMDSNKVVDQSQELVDQQDDATEANPAGAGTVNDLAAALVARALRDGAHFDDELVNSDIDIEASDEFDIELDESDLTDDIEKVAAVAALIDAGHDFEEAVALVKTAEEMLAEEAQGEHMDSLEQVKLASVNELMARGVDLSTAVAAVDEALNDLEKTAAAKKDPAMYAAAQAKSDKMLKEVLDKNVKQYADELKAKQNASGVRSGRIKAPATPAPATPAPATPAPATPARRSGQASARAPQPMGPAKPTMVQRASANKGKIGAGLAGLGVLGTGAYAATRNREKTAAAIEGLVGAGYSVSDALELMGL
jgi:hypothetical protein